MPDDQNLNLPTWYVYCFISEFVLIYPVYLIMMETSGIDAVGLSTLLMLWAFATFLFELPTGVIGDLFPRKHIMLLAGLLDAMAFAIWFLWPTYWGFAAGFVIWSLAGALASGTSEAYLFEVLNKPDDYERVYGRTEAFESVGVASALLLGGFLASFGFDLVLLLSVAGPLAGCAILWFLLPDLARPAREAAVQDFIPTLLKGCKTIVRQRRLFLVLGIAALLAAMAGVFEEYVGVLLREIEFPLTLVGAIYAGVWLARAVGSYFAERMRSATAPLILFAVTSGFLLISAFWSGWVLVIALLAFFAASGVLDVVYGAHLQRLINDDVRATITSVQSLTTEGFATILFLLVGLTAADTSWLGASSWLAGLALAAALGGTALAFAYLSGKQIKAE